MKRQPTEWGTLLANHISDKGFIFRIYKEHLKHNKKTNIPILKSTKDLNRYLFKEDMKMAKENTKRLSILLARREMQIKITM